MLTLPKRTQIRKAVVHILSNGGVAPYPTVAGPHVYDSKGDEIINVSEQENLPSILVYTDVEVGKPHVNAHAWPLEFVVELVIEIALGSNAYGAETNAGLEEQLDIMEEQVRTALFASTINGGPNKAANAFRKMYSKIHEYKSLRMGNNKNNQRLAMRGIVIDLCYTAQNCDLVTAFPALKSVGMRVASGDQSLDVITDDSMQ